MGMGGRGVGHGGEITVIGGKGPREGPSEPRP